jgi:ATP-dependent RNA helicase DeaD
VDTDTYKIKVGRADGVTPGNIVGAIANEADINSKHIGHIKLHDHYSTVDLPKGMPKETFDTLYKTWVCNKQLQLALVSPEKASGDDFKRKPKKNTKPKKQRGNP